MVNIKKLKERFYLENASKIWPNFPNGEIENSESPDFLIKTKDSIIGIEVTQFIRGQERGETSDRKNEADHQKILWIAQKKFEASHSKKLLVSPSWSTHKALDSKTITLLANTITEIIKKEKTEGLYGTIRLDYHYLIHTPLKDYCHQLCIRESKKSALWRSIEAGFISVISSQVQSIIDSKSGKFSCYHKKCKEVFLLIYCDGTHISSTADFEPIVSTKFTSPFKSVFVYDYQEKEIIKLLT